MIRSTFSAFARIVLALLFLSVFFAGVTHAQSPSGVPANLQIKSARVGPNFSSFTLGTYGANNTSGCPGYRFFNSGTQRSYIGLDAAAGGCITGSTLNDLSFVNNGPIRFSGDNGATTAGVLGNSSGEGLQVWGSAASGTAANLSYVRFTDNAGVSLGSVGDSFGGVNDMGMSCSLTNCNINMFTNGTGRLQMNSVNLSAVYVVDVSVGGSPAVVGQNPPGGQWAPSVSSSGTGIKVITHNFGTANYLTTGCTVRNNSGVLFVCQISANTSSNTATINLFTAAGALTDSAGNAVVTFVRF